MQSGSPVLTVMKGQGDVRISLDNLTSLHGRDVEVPTCLHQCLNNPHV